MRLYLGRRLLPGLEFLLAADILRATASPTCSEPGQLAAAVAIRTALDYFLARVGLPVTLRLLIRSRTAETAARLARGHF